MTAEVSSTSFWECFGVGEEDGLKCLEAVKRRYVGWDVEELGDQGYCSLTLLVSHPLGSSLIVQIRPLEYALDLDVVRAATETYPSLAPCVSVLEFACDFDLRRQLCVYEMQRMNGTPLSRLVPRCQDSNSGLRKKQETLVQSFATMIAQSLKSSPSSTKGRFIRADSPMDDLPSMLSQRPGKVGSTIISRLEKLQQNLPEKHLRTIASEILACIKGLNNYPVVLNHGDLIPSNILVDEETWEITGLVDWAEAEYLPFGTCLYGLEWLLGYMNTSREDSPTFVYYEDAPRLRELFWCRFFDLVPWLKTRETEVQTMRKLGILLWYGFAWDEGAIDRVVNDVDDPVELACLQAFLSVE